MKHTHLSSNAFYWLLLASMTAAFLPTKAQGLLLNEFSNGAAGLQEYYEYVVIGPDGSENCGPVDLRGWIIDDNNGDFSCGPIQGAGIAQGHVRFSNSISWSAIPTGSLILVYNNLDRNTSITVADDLNDSNGDLVYVVPITNTTLFERTSGDLNCPLVSGDQIPMACDPACPANASSSAYAPVTYVAGGSWTQISLANSLDAGQTRRPGGAYFHGVAYGSSTFMNGGPDGLYFAGTGTGRCYSFTNTLGNNYRSISNWTRGSVPTNETPGIANNAANAAWIASLQGGCTLPVTYSKPLQAYALPDRNNLKWSTTTEINSDHFRILRSTDVRGPFTEIGQIPSAQNSNQQSSYQFDDMNPPVHCFYRLAQVDASGTLTYSNTVEVYLGQIENGELRYWPQPAQDILNFEVRGRDLRNISLTDALGRSVQLMNIPDGVTVYNGSFDIQSLNGGVYFLQATSSNGALREKVVLLK